MIMFEALNESAPEFPLWTETCIYSEWHVLSRNKGSHSHTRCKNAPPTLPDENLTSVKHNGIDNPRQRIHIAKASPAASFVSSPSNSHGKHFNSS